jgi:hypothetical protein
MKPCRGRWKQKVHLCMARRSRLPGACIYPSARWSDARAAGAMAASTSSRLVARHAAWTQSFWQSVPASSLLLYCTLACIPHVARCTAIASDAAPGAKAAQPGGDP